MLWWEGCCHNGSERLWPWKGHKGGHCCYEEQMACHLTGPSGATLYCAKPKTDEAPFHFPCSIFLSFVLRSVVDPSPDLCVVKSSGAERRPKGNRTFNLSGMVARCKRMALFLTNLIRCTSAGRMFPSLSLVILPPLVLEYLRSLPVLVPKFCFSL